MIARLLFTLIFILLAQRALEPPNRSLTTGIVLYLITITWLLWNNYRGEWVLPEQPVFEGEESPFFFRKNGLVFFVPLCFITFLMFGNFMFTPANLVVWFSTFAVFLYIFWNPERSVSLLVKIRSAWIRFKSAGITISPWTLLFLIVFGFSAYFRFYLLNQVPAEMFSDHAEKLLDVRDVLNGQTSIYFPRNTGREAFQMYLTALIALVFNTGLSFISLKLGTAFCGLITLPFIYLLGKEIANRRVAILAMFFAGIAYWPNVISRVALRFTLYPTFTAPMLYFLFRGLRTRNQNNFILSGLFLGLGLHGYSPYRFVPIVVVIVIILFIIHRQSKEARKSALWGLVIIGLTAFIIFLPLLRYMVSNQTMFNYRMMTRMGQVERDFSEHWVYIFMDNLWKALTMLVWDNGQIWVHSIPFRPALSIVTATFTVIGVVLLVDRYITVPELLVFATIVDNKELDGSPKSLENSQILKVGCQSVKEKSWLDITLLVLIPLLMMPSILSLAFPEENPSLNRTSGAIVVVFIIAAMAFDGMLTMLKSSKLAPGGKWIAWVISFILITWSANQDYDLVFNQYAQQFNTNAWNTSELGAVIRQFADSSGAEDSAWVIPFPHWVDTRLVGIRAGFPERDYALWPENIVDTVKDPRAKLYLVKPEDTDSIELLRMYYPNGVLRLYESQVEGRDFYMYSIPPVE